MANKQEIIDYVMNSPANTNPNVLGNMLEELIKEQNKIVIAKLTITSDTTGTCNMSHDEIEVLTESGIPVIMTWTYKPDGAPFYVFSGCDTVGMATGTLQIMINKQEWICGANDGYEWKLG